MKPSRLIDVPIILIGAWLLWFNGRDLLGQLFVATHPMEELLLVCMGAIALPFIIVSFINKALAGALFIVVGGLVPIVLMLTISTPSEFSSNLPHLSSNVIFGLLLITLSWLQKKLDRREPGIARKSAG